jgi:RNA polymerase sigma factor (sigma-70 family)
VSVLSRRQFDALLAPIHAALYRFAVRLVGTNDADDCLQTGLLVGWNQISRFPPSPLSQDLLRFLAPRVRQACRQHRRDLARNVVDYYAPETLLPLLEQMSTDPTLELPDISARAYDQFREQMFGFLQRASLTRLQETCVREWLNGVTQQNIAVYLGISQQAVSQHIAAAAEKLRAVQYWEEEPAEWIVRFFWEQVAEIKRSIPQKRSKSRPVQKVRQRTATPRGQKKRTLATATGLCGKRGTEDALPKA